MILEGYIDKLFSFSITIQLDLFAFKPPPVDCYMYYFIWM